MDNDEPTNQEDKTNMLYSYNQVAIKPRNYSVTSEEEVEKTEFVNFGGYNGAGTDTTFGVGKIPSGKFVAHMDTCKAMTILGFSSAQTFETTSMEEIRKNFVYKMNMIASDNQKNSKSSKYTRRKQGSRQTELRKLNEAMQFLQKRQNRSEEILTQWRNYCQQNFERVVSNEIDAMSLDDTDTNDDEQNAEHWRKVMLKEAESKRAQALSEELIRSPTKSIDNRNKTKTKDARIHQKRWPSVLDLAAEKSGNSHLKRIVNRTISNNNRYYTSSSMDTSSDSGINYVPSTRISRKSRSNTTKYSPSNRPSSRKFVK